MRPSLELHVDELVLHGLPAGDRDRIAEALARELVRRLVEHGVPQSLALGGIVEQLDAGVFRLAPHTTSTALGGQIASAVYGGISAGDAPAQSGGIGGVE